MANENGNGGMTSADDNSISSLLRAARGHLGLRQFDHAVDVATKAIRLDPKRSESYVIRAEALRKLNKADRALADLTLAIRLNPDRPAPYVIRAEINKKRCLFDQAIADATQAIFLDPNNAAAFSIRASCRQSIGDPEGAALDQEELFRIDPTRSSVHLPGSDRTEASPTTNPDRSVAGQAARRTQPDAYKDLFADGNPVDRSLNARKPVGEVADKLAELSDYRPETMTRPLPPGRSKRDSPSHSPWPILTLISAGLAIVACLLLVTRKPVEPGVPKEPPHDLAPADSHVAGRIPTNSDAPAEAKPLDRPQSGPTQPAENVANRTEVVVPQSKSPGGQAEAKVGEVRRFEGHTGTVLGVAFSPDGKLVASAAGDATVRIWDTTAGSSGNGHIVLATSDPRPNGFIAVAFSPDGKMLAASKFDGSIALWDMKANPPRLTRVLRKHDDAVVALAFSPDGKTLVSGGRDKGLICFWDMTRSGDTPRTTIPSEKNGAWSLAFSPDGKTLAEGVSFPPRGGSPIPGEVWMWDVGQRPYIKRSVIKEVRKIPRSLAFSPDGGRLAFGDGDVARVIEVGTGKAVGSFEGHSSFVVTVAFTPDGKRVLSGGYDNVIRLWDATTMEEACRFDGHSGYVEQVAISIDGRRAASCGHDKTVRLWNIPAASSNRTTPPGP